MSTQDSKHTPEIHLALHTLDGDYYHEWVFDIERHKENTLNVTGGEIDFQYIPMSLIAQAPTLLERNAQLEKELREEKTINGINLDAYKHCEEDFRKMCDISQANIERVRKMEQERDTYSKLVHEKNDAIRDKESEIQQLEQRVKELEAIVDNPQTHNIPDWIIQYDKVGYQSSAGKAVRGLMEIVKNDQLLLNQSTRKSIEKDAENKRLREALGRIASRGKGVLKKIATAALNPNADGK